MLAMPEIFILPIILLTFPFFFIGMWSFVCLLISLFGGWWKLAANYQASEPPQGERFGMQSCRLGWANYNNCVVIHLSEAGIHLAVWPIFRIAHPPLFLPWANCRNPKVTAFAWKEMVTFEIGDPHQTTLTIPKAILNVAKRTI